METKKLKEEDLKNRKDGLRVGDLKKILNECNLPDDAIVMVERIHDVYFEKHGWCSYMTDTYSDNLFNTMNYSEFIPSWWAITDKDKYLLITVHF